MIRLVCSGLVSFLVVMAVLLHDYAVAPVSAEEATASLDLKVSLGKKLLRQDSYQMAVWLEDTQGTYIETLYVTERTAKDGLGNGYISLFGMSIRSITAVLPVWAHQRNIKVNGNYYPSREEPLPDAMTGATVKTQDFDLSFPLTPAILEKAGEELVCRVEVNVPRDGVPSINFAGTLALTQENTQSLTLIGFGEEKGRDGALRKEIKKKFEESQFMKELKATLYPERPVR